MFTALSRLLSFLLHPLLMPTYLYTLLSWALPMSLAPLRPEGHLPFIIMLFLLTFGLPAIQLGIFRVFGNIQSLSMPGRAERILPFLLITVIYVVSTYVLYTKMQEAPSDNAIRFLVIIDALVLVATLVTFFFKISVHCIAIWGMVGITILLTKISEMNTLLYVAIGLIVVAGLVMSARLQLGVHTYREVMWGSVLGLATSIAGMLILF
jgi:hypothetical protein